MRRGSTSSTGPMGPIVPVLKNGEGGGPGAVRGGKYMVDRLTALCARYGVPILLQHRAVDVEMAGGRVAAVWAESPEGRLRIACRACIVTTGSWINNQEILEKYEPAFARVKMGPSPHRNPN